MNVAHKDPMLWFLNRKDRWPDAEPGEKFFPDWLRITDGKTKDPMNGTSTSPNQPDAEELESKAAVRAEQARQRAEEREERERLARAERAKERAIAKELRHQRSKQIQAQRERDAKIKREKRAAEAAAEGRRLRAPATCLKFMTPEQKAEHFREQARKWARDKRARDKAARIAAGIEPKKRGKPGGRKLEKGELQRVPVRVVFPDGRVEPFKSIRKGASAIQVSPPALREAMAAGRPIKGHKVYKIQGEPYEI